MKLSIKYYICLLGIVFAMLGIFFDSKGYINSFFPQKNIKNSTIINECPPKILQYDRTDKIQVQAHMLEQRIYDSELEYCKKISIENDPILRSRGIYGTFILLIIIFLIVDRFKIHVPLGPVGAAISFLKMKDSLTGRTDQNYSDANTSGTTKKIVFIYTACLLGIFIFLYGALADLRVSLFGAVFFTFPIGLYLFRRGILSYFKK